MRKVGWFPSYSKVSHRQQRPEHGLQQNMLLSSESVSCHATCPQNVSAATALADAWRTEPDDALGDDYARHALTGEADAFRTPSPMGGDLC